VGEKSFKKAFPGYIPTQIKICKIFIR